MTLHTEQKYEEQDTYASYMNISLHKSTYHTYKLVCAFIDINKRCTQNVEETYALNIRVIKGYLCPVSFFCEIDKGFYDKN